jgi:hypothetical protein
MHLSPHPYVLHAPPTSFFLIWSLELNPLYIHMLYFCLQGSKLYNQCPDLKQNRYKFFFRFQRPGKNYKAIDIYLLGHIT